MVLLYRILLRMDMFLHRANAETYHLCRIPNPENGLSFSEGKASFRPQGLFSLSSPKTMPTNQHRRKIQREQTRQQQYTRMHTHDPYAILKPHHARENRRG